LSAANNTSMLIKYQVSFYLDHGGQLYLSFTFQGQRLKLYCGYRVNEKMWDPVAGQVRPNTISPEGYPAAMINKRLRDIQTTTENTYMELMARKETVTPESLRTEVRFRLGEGIRKSRTDFLVQFDQYVNYGEVGLRRRQLRSMVRGYLEAFALKHAFKLNFDTITPERLKLFMHFIMDGPPERSRNYAILILKSLRGFFNFARRSGATSHYPFYVFHIPQENYHRPVYLSEAELNQVFVFAPPNHLKKVKVLFCFQCFTGCRVSDLMSLTPDNLVGNAIEYIPRKTKNTVIRVPLSERALSLIDKNCQDNLLPQISAVNYNKGLKVLFKQAGLNRMVSVFDGQGNECRKPLHEVVTSHMARRTFIGILHPHVKNEVIAAMSGHMDGSKAFSRYYDVDEKTKQRAIRKYLK